MTCRDIYCNHPHLPGKLHAQSRFGSFQLLDAGTCSDATTAAGPWLWHTMPLDDDGTSCAACCCMVLAATSATLSPWKAAFNCIAAAVAIGVTAGMTGCVPAFSRCTSKLQAGDLVKRTVWIMMLVCRARTCLHCQPALYVKEGDVLAHQQPACKAQHIHFVKNQNLCSTCIGCACCWCCCSSRNSLCLPQSAPA